MPTSVLPLINRLAFSLWLVVLVSGCTIRSGGTPKGRISLTHIAPATTVVPATHRVLAKDVTVSFVRPVTMNSLLGDSVHGEPQEVNSAATIFQTGVGHTSRSPFSLQSSGSASRYALAASDSCTASEGSCAHQYVSAACYAPVYVIIIDSPVDPLRIGRLNQLAGVIRSAGFSNVEFFHPWVKGRSHHLTNRVLEIRRRCPEARVVLIGWSMGTIWAGHAARSLASQGVSIDSFINMDSKLYGPTSSGGYPANIHRTLLLYRKIANVPDGVPRSYVVRVNELMHLRVPSNTKAQNAILNELRYVAAFGISANSSGSHLSINANPSRARALSLGPEEQ